uniref:Uncharacterized protein n=1 Tax=Vombatus ursinus TaxID=29139 RepID=A0A4X2LMD6_VOMUR
MAHEGSRAGRDRGQSRAKAEKVRPPTVPVPQIEIVPGRLNESEWISLMGIEEGEDVVGDVLAELLARVMDAAFKVYLTQQCIPFTISQAREAMLQITEWRFLARDEGETDVAEDPTWGEDEEPRASTTDTWAQGSVPVLHAPSPAIPTGLESSSQPETWISVPEDQSLSFWEPPELRPTPGPPPTPEPSSHSPQHFAHPCQNSVPLLSSFPSLDLSIWESSQFSLEVGSSVSPHPSLDVSIWASPQASLTSQPGYIPSLSQNPQPPFHCTGGGDSSSQVRETGLPSPYYLSVPLPPFLASPPWGLPRAQPVPAPKTSLTPALLPAASAKFMRLQQGRSYLASGLVYDQMGRIVAMDPLDPTRLPQHHIQPLATLPSCPGPRLHPGFPFPWPYGLEGETDLLQRQPLGSSLIPGAGSGQMPRSDLSLLPHHGSRVLEATSQLIWKPSQLLDSMKLKAHVSLWNPSKNMHRSGGIPSHMEREQTPDPLPKEPSEQQPIQTHALNPQVTVAQLLKGSPPKVRALPSQDTVSTTLPKES